MLSSIMEIKVEEYFKKHRATTELEESKKEMFVRLHQRECIVRLFDGVKYLLPMKLKIVDARKWGLREGADPYVERTPPPEAPGVLRSKPMENAFVNQAPQDSERHLPPAQPLPRMSVAQQKGEEPPRTEAPIDSATGLYCVAEEGEKPPGEEKEEKPDLPEPMTDSPWLQETPDAIYQLGKAKMNGDVPKEAETIIKKDDNPSATTPSEPETAPKTTSK